MNTLTFIAPVRWFTMHAELDADQGEEFRVRVLEARR